MPNRRKSQDNGVMGSLLHFAVGGFSGAFATSVIQPIDTLKVQIQLISEREGRRLKRGRVGFAHVFRNIWKQKGLAVFYRGLDSAILRQIFYASARLGSYTWATDRLKKNDTQINISLKVLLSSLSGIFGAIVGNPFDVALVRRQASVTTGETTYSNTYQAFRGIIQKEGVSKLWRGIQITMLRVCLINVGQLAGHQIITQTMKPLFSESSGTLSNLSALLASFLTAFISLPADNIKVKLQKQTPHSTLYTGILHCFRQTVQRQGFTRLWVGFPIYLIRGTPHSFILIRTRNYLQREFLD